MSREQRDGLPWRTDSLEAHSQPCTLTWGRSRPAGSRDKGTGSPGACSRPRALTWRRSRPAGSGNKAAVGGTGPAGSAGRPPGTRRGPQGEKRASPVMPVLRFCSHPALPPDTPVTPPRQHGAFISRSPRCLSHVGVTVPPPRPSTGLEGRQPSRVQVTPAAH